MKYSVLHFSDLLESEVSLIHKQLILSPNMSAAFWIDGDMIDLNTPQMYAREQNL